jgi:hypothetical protein
MPAISTETETSPVITRQRSGLFVEASKLDATTIPMIKLISIQIIFVRTTQSTRLCDVEVISKFMKSPSILFQEISIPHIIRSAT